jgi:alpha-beta hydrolase superfamily lysophospholipase
VEPDVLGTPYERQTIELRADAEGPVTATLIRRRAESPSGAAVLYLHGFIDYFFQTHLADFFVEQGIDFYAMDLRKHGRSLAPHQTPNFCLDLGEYYEEVDEAVRIIREDDGHDRLLVNGHSTGGLIAALWAHDRRDAGLVDALFLNSPFFDLNAPWFLKEVGTPLSIRVGRVRPRTKLPLGLNPVYAKTIHSEHGGEWAYDLAWKPLAGYPILAGWLRAIRAGQRRVHAGLDIRVPIIVAASAVSYKSTKLREAAFTGDAILDVAHMARWSPGLGRHVTVVRIDGGLHDLTLSREPARRQLFDEVGRWLGAYFPK